MRIKKTTERVIEGRRKRQWKIGSRIGKIKDIGKIKIINRGENIETRRK